MLKNKKKKAFTIVELVIVIAVIAILAAVLIPTFASLIEKANLSSDIQAVRQMNIVLAAESIEEAPATFEALVKILRNANYNVDEGLIPVSTDHHFLWHQTHNVIFLAKATLDEDGSAKTAALVYPEDHEGLADFDAEMYNSGDVYNLADCTTGDTSGAGTGLSLPATLDIVRAWNDPWPDVQLSEFLEPADTAVTWTTSDENVATVDGNGKVSVNSEYTGGTVTITATAGGKSATCKVTFWTEVPNLRRLKTALASGGHYKLNYDGLNLTTGTDIEFDTVLDLNGNTLIIGSSDIQGRSCIDVFAGKTLTIIGSGTLQTTGSGANEAAGGGHGAIYVAKDGGTLILDGVTINHLGGICLQNHGNLTIKGCTFTGKNQTIFNGQVNDGVPTPGTLYIENTEFDVDAPTETPWPVIWNRESSTVKFVGNVTITGTMRSAYYGGAFKNEGGYTTGTPTIDVTYSQSAESP